ncbi:MULTISPECIES: TRAP transporter large permease subunit [unclassified Mesorhizobium]|uniref:TRAP transporter large permease n=1 Tax=unclassified Mesorhizobium TaxID=325217 RepID=UPI00112972DF|nr:MULTISPECIES: TRAP transporter large permease subunit [unclassified Mesorhizobium]MBZ9920984.1 TRAP transporter large permease subunit [Mesorhizobium sp. BR1-1-7]MBZ9956630.1 TRAP transporter large permease subunit [Mesorhizobium sp. BR1-1-15]MBZ9973764.1 TRAP transporter large permease subunit [Mesorhizobium sp. BR1-1-12]TPJ56112.1 TRAP transporter large permease subunit [Mesorhizobium sp. B2-6-4]TPL58618.1 TRAP transporter large permease subunit [Mesorhizobium sp. B2-4-2]
MSGLVFIGSLLGAMGIGIPIAFALMLSGVAMMLLMGNLDAQILAQRLVNGADSYPLMAIPFFLIAGELMNAGGLSRRIVNVALALFGHIRGGLGYVVIGTGLLMASLSGSAIADTATLAVMLIPLMRDAGYSMSRASGLMAATGIIAPVIPPSVGFIILGVTANISIVGLFLAGIVPGILMGLSLVVTWWIVSRKETSAVQPKLPRRDIPKAILTAGWALMLPVIILVGLRFGIFTPTEAGVVAAFYALFVGLVVYRELTPRLLFDALLDAGRMTAVIMLLVAASVVTGFMMTIASLPAQLVTLLSPFIDMPILLMAMIVLAIFVIGMVLDFAPSITILVPILMPLVTAAGIDPIYFGVMFIMTAAVGMITPPVGTVLNTVCGISKVSMGSALRGVWPFLLAEMVLIVLLVLFPALVTVPAGWFH